jgi:hypothetical protein
MYGEANPYRILAYSEMMPAPLIGWLPYGTNHPAPRRPDNLYAWLRVRNAGRNMPPTSFADCCGMLTAKSPGV